MQRWSLSRLTKTLNSQDESKELKFMEKLYNDDVNISVLPAQMEILQVLLKDADYFCFDDIIVKIKELPNPEREMIIYKPWLHISVNPLFGVWPPCCATPPYMRLETARHPSRK